MKRYNLTGQKYGRLCVIQYSHTSKNKDAMWECECECGNVVFVSSHDLRNGHTKSCGCLQRERASRAKTRHGKSQSRIYFIYKGMKARCYNKKGTGYKDYGARGIKICDEWLGEDGFICFYKWAMANGYSDNRTIDRKDVNGNYEPSNCRWATMKEQQSNRRSCHYETYNGETKNIKEWSEILGIPRHTLSRKLAKGITLEMMFGKEVKNYESNTLPKTD